MKKVCIFIVTIITLVLIVFSAKILIEDYKIKHAKIEITLVDNLTTNFTEERHVSDFISSINGTIVDDYIIDSTKIGKKKVNFEFINDEGIKIPYSYTITIIDNIPPIIWLDNSYSITVGEDVDLTSEILCGDNEDSSPTRYIEGDYDYNTVGSYPLVFKAIDRSGNTSEKEFTLYVNEKSNNTQNDSTSKTYTNFSDVVKKYKKENTKIGIDVSIWQGDINFEAIKNAGVEFIIIRVGSSEGRDGDYYLDSQFINNIKQANEYDIDVGIYFYSYADSKKHAIDDALWVIDQIKDYKITLPIAFDWENWNSFNDYHLSFWELSNMANAFLDTVAEHGYTGMLYSSKNYLEQLWLPTKYNVWLAHYATQTDYQGEYDYWQLCNNGKIDGIDNDVDIDIMYIY